MAENWEFGKSCPPYFLTYDETKNTDLSDPNFPGILALDGGYVGPRPTPELHPHLQLEATMTSMPKVKPGDAVFWHVDVVHSVEQEHKGTEDTAGKNTRDS